MRNVERMLLRIKTVVLRRERNPATFFHFQMKTESFLEDLLELNANYNYSAGLMRWKWLLLGEHGRHFLKSVSLRAFF